MGWGIFSQWVGWGDEGGGRGDCLREAKAVQSVEAIHPRLCHRLAPSNISGFFFNSVIVSALIAFFCLVFLPPCLLPSVPAHSSFFPFPQPLTSSFLFAMPSLLSLAVSLSYCPGLRTSLLVAPVT